MGFFGKTIKRNLKKIKNGLSKLSRSPSVSCSGYEEPEPTYEEITFLETTKTTLLTPVRNAASTQTTPLSHNLIEFSPDTPPPLQRPNIEFRELSGTPLETSPPNKPDSSSDSGISETTNKIKRLQFSNLVQEYKLDPVETDEREKMIFKRGEICKAKYYETQAPQKVQILPSAPELYLSLGQVHQGLPKCDVLDITRYGRSPPKPMRSAYRMKKIQEQQKLTSSSESDDNGSPKLKALKPILRHRLPSIIPSSSDDEITIIPKINKCSEAIYAQVTPRSSRYIKPPHRFSPEPRSSTSCSPNSSKENLSPSVESNSKESLPTLPRSEDFLPEASSSINNIVPAASRVKNHNDVWSLNNFLSDEVLIEKAKSDDNILSESTKKSLALIHETQWSLDKEQLLKNHECNIQPKSPVQSAVESKFVVNAYESRRSARNLKYKAPRKPSSPKLEVDEFLCEAHRNLDETIRNLENESIKLHKENEIESSGSSVDSDKVEMLISDHSGNFNDNVDGNNNNGPTPDLIKSKLHVQQREFYRQTKICNYKIMVEASNALEELHRSGKRSADKNLIIQKVLLETDERIQLINKHIIDLSYTKINDNCPNKAKITLSNIDIPLKHMNHFQKQKDKKHVENFLITVSHGADLFVSDFIEEKMDLLSLDQKFTFDNMPPDFEIKVKLFWVKLKTSKKGIRWGKSFKPSASKVVYKDREVNELQKKEVFRTSFQLCGEATLTRDHIDRSFSELRTKDPKVFPRISGRIQHYVHCDIETNADMSGFLDVGAMKNDVLFWRTKYCVLMGNDFWIYNDPNDWQFGNEPAEKINLSFSFGPIVKKIENYSKSRCFQLTTARPNNGSRNVSLKSKPNFMQKRFYFAAREKNGFEEWTSKLDQLYQTLRIFKKLFLDKEYESYSKSLL